MAQFSLPQNSKIEVGNYFKDKTNSKNLRSKGGLQILGYWVKGRLEDANIISIGDLIDENHLKKYGRNNIELISTNSEDLFLLNFKP